MKFEELASQLCKQENREPFKGTLLSFDPGLTTGWALFVGHNYLDAGQLSTKTIDEATPHINALINEHTPTDIVYEDYRVYRWRQKQHVNSELMTTRVIGCIETLSTLQVAPFIHVSKQPAQIAKNFCTDARLKEWGFWVEGERHARDAIRHACYYILFGGRKQWHKRKQKQTQNAG